MFDIFKYTNKGSVKKIPVESVTFWNILSHLEPFGALLSGTRSYRVLPGATEWNQEVPSGTERNQTGLSMTGAAGAALDWSQGNHSVSRKG